jgi:hypothetical protein
MTQFVGFGNGSDGVATLSGTDAPIDSSCSGNAASTSLSATNVSFAAGQIILIHQSRGTGVGQWEFNKIASYTAGTITTVLPLDYTYTDSGSSQAQVLVVKQYSGVTISGTLIGKLWNENVGGILSFLSTGQVNITGSIINTGLGYNGAIVAFGSRDTGFQSEGTVATSYQRLSSANGSGGGGGVAGVHSSTGAGGGGGHSASGGTGAAGTGPGAVGGTGGNSSGLSDLTNMTFGGGAGAGGNGTNAGDYGDYGGNGGGIIVVYAPIITLSGAGVITNSGGDGGNGNGDGGAGGAGAGGSILLKGNIITAGTNKITAVAGTPGNRDGRYGGTGADGRIRLEACTLSGETNPSASVPTAPLSWCSLSHAIL